MLYSHNLIGFLKKQFMVCYCIITPLKKEKVPQRFFQFLQVTRLFQPLKGIMQRFEDFYTLKGVYATVYNSSEMVVLL